jgi:hypothetical protein
MDRETGSPAPGVEVNICGPENHKGPGCLTVMPKLPWLWALHLIKWTVVLDVSFY